MNWKDALNAAPPPSGRLYHYTTIEGVYGIVDSKTLQATNSRYLNDASEVRFALDLIRKELRKRRKSVNVLSKEGIFYKNLTNRIGYVDEIQIRVTIKS